MTMSHERLEADEFFESSFLALTGYSRMPWQMRLFRTHFLSGDLPKAVSIPTGLGKTAVMAVWLIGLAWQIRTQATPSLPRRLVYVVDRRAVVDQSTTFAEKLRKALVTPAANELRTALGFTAGQKLTISTLRGQFVDNREWLEDPSQPAIIVGTVDMIGSRLLFEGYGVSRKMRPYHAGLLGADSLVLLDEAHLVPPFEALLASIADEPSTYGARAEEDRGRVPTFKLLSLSATNRSSGENVFSLKAEDCSDPEDEGAKRTRERLEAVKRLRIVTDGKDLSKKLADQAWTLSGNGRDAVRCLVYCDKRDDAEKVYSELLKRLVKLKSQAKNMKGEDAQQAGVRQEAAARQQIDLFVGARRVRERIEAEKRLDSLGFLAESKTERTSACFLVATSAGEVGVDLDADHMVCDLVPWERMVQRFGRVNRRGFSPADVVVVAPPPVEPKTKLPEESKVETLEEPVKPAKPDVRDKKTMSHFKGEQVRYKEALKSFKEKQKEQDRKKADYDEAAAKYQADWTETFLYRRRIALLERLSGDASPGALRNLSVSAISDDELKKEIQTCSTPDPLRPALTRPLVDAWSMTSLEEHTGRPRVEPWLRGWVSDEPQTTLAWRTHLPLRANTAGKKSEIKAFFEAAPLHTSELLETETWRVVDRLMQRVAVLLSTSAPATPADTDEELSDEDTQDALANGEPVVAPNPGAGDSAAPTDGTPPTLAARMPADAATCLTLKPDDVIGMIFSPEGNYERTLLARDIPVESPDNDAQKKREREAKDTLQKELFGATLVLSARIGGLDNGLLNEKADSLAVTADDGSSWGRDATGKPLIPFRIRDSQAGEVPDETGEWHESWRFELERDADSEATHWLVIEEWPDSDNTEERRSSGPAQSLAEHQSCTETKAREIARRLGLSGDYMEVLATAARLHDEGKKAPRWQDAFRAHPGGRPYAKTKGPINFKLLDGYRHEFGSLPYAADALKKLPQEQRLSQDLQDLVLHLIAAHHGFARPVIATDSCEDAPPSTLKERAREVALRFACLQRRWGPWGLAWWEALLRAADQQASRDNNERGGKPRKEKG